MNDWRKDTVPRIREVALCGSCKCVLLVDEHILCRECQSDLVSKWAVYRPSITFHPVTAEEFEALAVTPQELVFDLALTDEDKVQMAGWRIRV